MFFHFCFTEDVGQRDARTYIVVFGHDLQVTTQNPAVVAGRGGEANGQCIVDTVHESGEHYKQHPENKLGRRLDLLEEQM
jgi:hypothetical protein